MEALMAVLVGLLFGVGIHLMQQRSLLRLVLGMVLTAQGANVSVIAMAGVGGGAAPIILPGITDYADPLPQALILTAIVIGFGVTAFLLVLAYRTYQESGTDDLEALRGMEDEVEAGYD